MFIYNITAKVDWSIHESWLKWMINSEIPRMLSTPHFTRHQFVRLLNVDDGDGPTYAIQYFIETLESYDQYIAELSAIDNANMYALWKDRCLVFTTIMEVVN